LAKIKNGGALVLPRQSADSLPWYTKTESRMLMEIVCGYCGREIIGGDTAHVLLSPEGMRIAFLCDTCLPVVTRPVT